MSNHNFVCFGCRTAARRYSLAFDVRCPSCRAQMTYIGHKARIPPKSRSQEWKAFQNEFHRRLAAREINLRSDGQFGVKALETQIKKLEVCLPVSSHTKEINKMKLRLTRHVADIRRQ